MSETPYLDSALAAARDAYTGKAIAYWLRPEMLDAATAELAALRADAALGRLVREAVAPLAASHPALLDNCLPVYHTSECGKEWTGCICDRDARMTALNAALRDALAAAQAAHQEPAA